MCSDQTCAVTVSAGYNFMLILEWLPIVFRIVYRLIFVFLIPDTKKPVLVNRAFLRWTSACRLVWSPLRLSVTGSIVIVCRRRPYGVLQSAGRYLFGMVPLHFQLIDFPVVGTNAVFGSDPIGERLSVFPSMSALLKLLTINVICPLEYETFLIKAFFSALTVNPPT